MSAIEERVVQMKWDGAQFANGAKQTLDQLAALKASLKLDGASKGLEEANAAVNRFSTHGMRDQISSVASHFSAMQVAAVTALATIAHQAIATGTSVVRSLTIDPVMEGLREYETNLNSIQTIMANTGLKGAAGLKTVTDALDELNRYSDQTIYNFSEMARNIGTFTAAGVELDVSVAAIKGIANLAAISGSNAEQASSAMYQLSQALASGKVSLIDWNSVVNAGMGGEVFRNSLLETADVHGKAVDKILSGEVSFRDSLQDGWLTAEILTETLSKFTGELTADQLKSMGYNKEQIAGILEMGETAVNAATKVKTMTQLLSTLRESATSGWAKTWQLVFGDFDEAKTMFTNVNNVLGGMITASADARNKLIGEWRELGGRDALIQGIAAGFQALLAVIRPVRDAFRQIFPATTAQQLYEMTVSFRNFMERLKIGEGTANNLRRTFAGFFAILGIGWELLKAGIAFFAGLFGSIGDGNGGVLEFTGSIGDFLVSVHRAVKEGEFFTRFFDKIAQVIDIPLRMIRKFTEFLGNMFEGFDGSGAGDAIFNLINGIRPMEAIGDLVSASWENAKRVFDDVFNAFYPLANKLEEWARKIPGLFGNLFGDMNYDAMVGGIQTGLVGALVGALIVGVKSFISGDGLFGNLVDAIENLTGVLGSMQNTLRAATLLQIAAAIALLAASLTILSHIDADGLERALWAMGILFTQLGAAMAAFSFIGTAGTAAKLIIMGVGLVALGAAILVFASAVEKLSKMDVKELAKGLTAVAVLIGTLILATRFMDTSTGGMIRTAAGLILLGAAVRILVESVEKLSEFSWQELAKGLVGVGALLGALILFTQFAKADAGGIRQGAGIILLAVALRILADAVGDFAEFEWNEIIRGMSGIGIGLGLIVAAMNLIPPGAIVKAAGVTIIAASLKLINDAVQDMSGMKWDEIARGMTVLAGSLGIITLALALLPKGAIFSGAAVLAVAASLGMIQDALADMAEMDQEGINKSLTTLAISLALIAGAVRAMTGALPGAAALLVVAAALAVLTPVLKTLGGMSWEEIAKGLAVLAGVFLIVGVAGLVLAKVTPFIFALAASIALLGVAVFAAGAGVLMFAIGLGLLAAAGAGATVALVALVAGLLSLIPMAMEQIGLGLVAFAKVIGEAAPAFKTAMVSVLTSLMDGIIELTPKIGDTLMALLTEILDILEEATPKLIDAGYKLLKAVLNGIKDNIGEITNIAIDIVLRFIAALRARLGEIIQAGFDLALAFVNGLANAIRSNQGAMNDAGWNLASALVEGVVKGIKSMMGRAASAAANMAKEALNAAKEALGINSPSKRGELEVGKPLVQGVSVGIERFGSLAADSAANVGHNIVDAMGKTIAGLDTLIQGDMDLNPTITPVLDLSNVTREAKLLSSLMELPPLEMAGTYSRASRASEGIRENLEVRAQTDGEVGGDTYNFTQNNTSPRPLPPAEIYRKTKSVIALARKRGDSDAE